MKQFAHLILNLEQTTKTSQKLKVLEEYFSYATDPDKLWALALLSGRRPKRTIRAGLLAEWSAEVAKTPMWLFFESYHIVGDLAETISLILPDQSIESNKSLSDWMDLVIDLINLDEEEKKTEILKAWAVLNKQERFVFNKIITGGWRIGVSQQLVIKGLAKVIQQDPNVVTHRITGNWSPLDINFQDLLFGELNADISRPYPFYLAYQLDQDPESLGKPKEWQAEYKWDGIRGQIIKRDEVLFIWSRGEDLITEKFPEFKILKSILPDKTVIDGEIICMKDGKVLPFNLLQTRIGRKNVSNQIMKQAPVGCIAYDLMELNGEDLRNIPMEERRLLLERLIFDLNIPDIITISPLIDFTSWDQLKELRATSRDLNSEGLMLKRKDSIYETGRRRGKWWKWKIDPYSVDAVLIYAQRGHGRRANLYTDFTFAVWDEGKLVPFAKAYSGLTDVELIEVDRFVKKHTTEKFGPVRSVKPELVFELAFEGIAKSSRHKSGIALRFPRISRWRKDKRIEDADNIDYLKRLLE